MRQSNFAKKSLGQNFLVDQNCIQRIINALEPERSETIIEIGPGRGAITQRLVDSGSDIIAIELDRELVPMLRERFKPDHNFQIVEGDATQINFDELLNDHVKAKVVANLPYYISTAILQHLSSQRHCFSQLVLMFQKEVVDRITAKPGDSERGFLSVLVESAFSVEKLFDVPPSAFKPVPKVTSSVARFTPKENQIDDEKALRDLLSLAFAQKRKTILNNLKSKFPHAQTALTSAGIDPKRRAESLSLDEWLLLHGLFSNN